MGRGILITRPNYDLATTYLFYWCKPVIQKAKDAGVQILDLSGNKANLKNLLSYVQKRKPSFLFFNGHGGPDFIAGHDGEILINASNYKKVMLGTIVYSRSCESAVMLGPFCVKAGTLAFIGYSKNFIVGYLEERETRPLTDNLAKLFLEPSNRIAISILKRNSVQTSIDRSQKMIRKNLRYMLSSKASSDEKDAAPYLWSNMQHLVVYGDTQASI